MEYNQCYDFELVIPWISVNFRLHHLFGTALDVVHVYGTVCALVEMTCSFLLISGLWGGGEGGRGRGYSH